MGNGGAGLKAQRVTLPSPGKGTQWGSVVLESPELLPPCRMQTQYDTM